MLDLESVASLDQYVKVVTANARKWLPKSKEKQRTKSSWLPWFRGEENADWDTALRPKLYRTNHDLIEVLRQEQDLRLEFKRRGTQLVGEGKPSDHGERYFLMEHYGVPTRLLDWSDGALVALYFALRPVKNTHDAAVYMLDPWWLNKLVFKELPVAKQDRCSGSAMPDWDEAKPYLSEDEFENEFIGPKFPLRSTLRMWREGSLRNAAASRFSAAGWTGWRRYARRCLKATAAFPASKSSAPPFPECAATLRRAGYRNRRSSPTWKVWAANSTVSSRNFGWKARSKNAPPEGDRRLREIPHRRQVTGGRRDVGQACYRCTASTTPICVVTPLQVA